MAKLTGNPRARVALTVAALMVLGAVACNLPTTYKAEMGQALQISMSQAALASSPGIEPMLAAMDELPGVENVMVNEQIGPESVRLDVMLWGQKVNADQVIADLKRDFPLLADAEIAVTPLTGDVKGKLFERIGREVFDFEIEVTGDTAEEIRKQILEQLAAQGYDGDAVVEVHMDEDQATIDIELTHDEVEDGN